MSLENFLFQLVSACFSLFQFVSACFITMHHDAANITGVSAAFSGCSRAFILGVNVNMNTWTGITNRPELFSDYTTHYPEISIGVFEMRRMLKDNSFRAVGRRDTSYKSQAFIANKFVVSRVEEHHRTSERRKHSLSLFDVIEEVAQTWQPSKILP